jgi:lipopolysaccharide/colanic/teichoic acid biosynthesis glycosyltransferase
MFKRIFDFVLAFAGLVVLSPVLMAVAVLVKLDSAGPVLFRQRRVGRGLRCFTLFKFRTMVAAHNGGEITVADDHRVTRLGRMLRLAKLDELPQLWNILSGDMSFVGPRPLVESTVNRFREDYRWILGKTRPGVTDPASIKYRHESAILGCCAEPVDYYFRVIMPDKIRLQKAYLRRQSLLGDVMILCRTLAACCRLGVTLADGENSQAAESTRAVEVRISPSAMETVPSYATLSSAPASSDAGAWQSGVPLSHAPSLPESAVPEFSACLAEKVSASGWEMDAR